jgi:hypothetical protein
MITEAAPSPGGRARTVLRWLVGLTIILLGLFILDVVLHAAFGGAPLFLAAQALAAGMVGSASASALLGVVHSWRSYPQHRRAIAFVVALTLVTLLAHAYILGTPAASTPGLVTGSPNSTFGDDRVTVHSTLGGEQLTITVQATGSSAIGQIDVTDHGAPIPDGGFRPPPNYSAPLLPGDTAFGTWFVSPGENISSVSVGYQYLSCYDTNDQVYGCIMDEVFYVPAAQHMLAGAQCQMGAPRDSPGYCNPEHPPLTKALLAAGMAVFGEYNSAGWRVMPALLGTFSVPLLFGTAWKVSGSKRLAALSALLLALDVLFFSQSSGALLDIPSLFLSLAAFFAYFADLKWWRFDRYVVAGTLLGAAGLAKETAVFAALALITYIFLFEERPAVAKLLPSIKVVVVAGLVFAGGLQAYDSTMASAAVPNVVQHVSYMLSYGASLIADKLACQPTTGYWCKYPGQPGGPPILPTDWLVYYTPVGYYLVSVTTNPGNLSYVSVGYYGITNLIETWTTFIWVPLVAYYFYDYHRTKKAGEAEPPAGPPGGASAAVEPPRAGLPGELRFGGVASVMFLWAYVPYLVMSAFGRVTYPFYFVDAVPAVAMGAAFWLDRKWFPKWLVYVYLAAAFVFFLAYFPDKSFLPIWLRVLLRH